MIGTDNIEVEISCSLYGGQTIVQFLLAELNGQGAQRTDALVFYFSKRLALGIFFLRIPEEGYVDENAHDLH